MSDSTKEQIIETEKIDLMRIINNMWKGFKRYWLLMLIVISFLGSAFTLKAFYDYSPMYSASATFTISTDTSSLYSGTSYLNTRTAGQIVKTFPYILNSGILQKKVAAELGREAMPGSVRAEILGSTNMITIVTNASDPQHAYDILQAVIKHYPEVAEPVIGQVKMNLLDITDVPKSPANPFSFKGDLIKGTFLGVVLCGAVLLLYAFTRSTIYEEEDIKKMLNIDCICAIPQIVFKKRGNEDFRKDISIYNKRISQTFLEAVRVLRARIEKDAKKNNLKVFLVTSAAPGEGKSTIAANIGMALSMRGSKAVLVDCDLRNPSVRERLYIPEDGPGLSEYLTGEVDLREVVLWNEKYKMYVVPGGAAMENGSELIDSPRMAGLLEELKKIAEYVILDTAPVGVLTDTAVLAEAADAALFVVKQDYANRATILEGIDQLAESKIYISGCILNGAQAGIGGYGYRQYRYYNKYGDYLYGSHYGEPSKEDLHED